MFWGGAGSDLGLWRTSPGAQLKLVLWANFFSWRLNVEGLFWLWTMIFQELKFYFCTQASLLLQTMCVWWNHSVPTGKILSWVRVWNGSRRREYRALIDWWVTGLWCSIRGPSAWPTKCEEDPERSGPFLHQRILHGAMQRFRAFQ